MIHKIVFLFIGHDLHSENGVRERATEINKDKQKQAERERENGRDIIL